MIVGLLMAGTVGLASPLPTEEEVAAATDQVAQVADEVSDAKTYTEELSGGLRSLVCRLQDGDALAAKAEDIPDGWELPSIEVYEAEGATCSQIPVRQAAELKAAAEVAAEATAAESATKTSL